MCFPRLEFLEGGENADGGGFGEGCAGEVEAGEGVCGLVRSERIGDKYDRCSGADT